MIDRTTTIKASLHDVERALVIAVGLVVLVVFAFLRNLRATLIPSVTVPVSLIGTVGAMYLLGYGSGLRNLAFYYFFQGVCVPQQDNELTMGSSLYVNQSISFS